MTEISDDESGREGSMDDGDLGDLRDVTKFFPSGHMEEDSVSVSNSRLAESTLPPPISHLSDFSSQRRPYLQQGDHRHRRRSQSQTPPVTSRHYNHRRRGGSVRSQATAPHVRAVGKGGPRPGIDPKDPNDCCDCGNDHPDIGQGSFSSPLGSEDNYDHCVGKRNAEFRRQKEMPPKKDPGWRAGKRCIKKQGEGKQRGCSILDYLHCQPVSEPSSTCCDEMSERAEGCIGDWKQDRDDCCEEKELMTASSGSLTRYKKTQRPIGSRRAEQKYNTDEGRNECLRRVELKLNRLDCALEAIFKRFKLHEDNIDEMQERLYLYEFGQPGTFYSTIKFYFHLIKYTIAPMLACEILYKVLFAGSEQN